MASAVRNWWWCAALAEAVATAEVDDDMELSHGRLAAIDVVDSLVVVGEWNGGRWRGEGSVVVFGVSGAEAVVCADGVVVVVCWEW